MSWLNDRIIKYVFSNGDEEIILEAKASEDRPPTPEGYTYNGFLPEKTNLMTRVQFTQNGRIGYRIDIGGKQIYRSATRERYEHTIGNTSSQAFAEAKKQGRPRDTTETVFDKKYGKAVKELKAKKDADTIKKLKTAMKEIK